MRDSITYCEGVFRLSLLKTSTFLDTKDTVVNAPPAYDYVDWWPSCHCVLHIERVWSTIVYFLSASDQNVQQNIRKRLHIFVVLLPIYTAEPGGTLLFLQWCIFAFLFPPSGMSIIFSIVTRKWRHKKAQELVKEWLKDNYKSLIQMWDTQVITKLNPLK